MIRKKNRIIFCSIVIFLNVAFIWLNSLLPREMSSTISRFVGEIVSLFLPGDYSVAQGEGHGILRKIAHFAEFASLGFFLSWLSWMVCKTKWKAATVPAFIGIAVAAIDETIQIFVPGRGPHIRDVGIDSLGVVLGCIVIICIVYLGRNKNHSEQ